MPTNEIKTGPRQGTPLPECRWWDGYGGGEGAESDTLGVVIPTLYPSRGQVAGEDKGGPGGVKGVVHLLHYNGLEFIKISITRTT